MSHYNILIYGNLETCAGSETLKKSFKQLVDVLFEDLSDTSYNNERLEAYGAFSENELQTVMGRVTQYIESIGNMVGENIVDFPLIAFNFYSCVPRYQAEYTNVVNRTIFTILETSADYSMETDIAVDDIDKKINYVEYFNASNGLNRFLPILNILISALEENNIFVSEQIQKQLTIRAH